MYECCDQEEGVYLASVCTEGEDEPLSSTTISLYKTEIFQDQHIKKPGDNKSRHLYVSTACLKFSVWVICWHVCTHTSVVSCRLVTRERRQEQEHGRQSDNEPMKSPLRRGQEGRSGSLRTHLIRAWVTRELNQITSSPWQLNQFPPFPSTSVISRKGNGAKLPLSDEIYMATMPLSFLTSVPECLLSLGSAQGSLPFVFQSLHLTYTSTLFIQPSWEKKNG